MMIAIVEKLLNVSHGLKEVGAQGFMVQNALSLVNYVENKIKIFQLVPRISNSTYVDYLVLVVYIRIYFCVWFIKKNTHMYTCTPKFCYNLHLD